MNKIIKIIISTFLLMFALSNISFARSNCSIKSTSKSINDYISAEKKILSNITKDLDQSAANKTNVSSNLWKTKAKFTQTYNNIINWWDYFSYFKYSITFPATQEIPYEVTRDHKIIFAEKEALEKFLQKIISNWTEKSIVKYPCDWVNANLKCNFTENMAASEVIAWLVKNNDMIATYFRDQIIWENFESKDSVFLLDKTTFEKDYNKSTASSCSADWWLWDRFTKELNNITEWQSFAGKWIWEWKDALTMLKCNNWWECSEKDKIKYVKNEKNATKNELSNQWISSNISSNMLKNLDNFNSKCSEKWLISSISCWATMAFDNTVSSMSDAKNDLRTTIWWLTKNFSFWKNKPVSYTNVIKQNQKDWTKNDLKWQMDYLYNQWLSSLRTVATPNDSVEYKLIEMHLSVSRAIKTLDDTIEKSRQVCNKQASNVPAYCN